MGDFCGLCHRRYRRGRGWSDRPGSAVHSVPVGHVRRLPVVRAAADCCGCHRTGYGSAGIAGSKPMPTAVQAFKLAQGFFLIPAMMAFSTLIWTDGDTIWGYVESILATVALIGAFAGAIEGQWATRLGKHY